MNKNIKIKINQGLGLSIKSNKFPEFINSAFLSRLNAFSLLRKAELMKRADNIRELKKQSSWRSLRHRQGLPTKNQRTHTNSKTCKRMMR